MTASIIPAPLAGTVDILPSKSHLHRELIAVALSGAVTPRAAADDGDDIAATKECLFRLGTPNATYDCGESGSTLRFLIPIVGARGTGGTFTGRGKLGERPITPLLDCLTAHGLRVSAGFPIKLEGRLAPGKYTIPGGISSQFITGLLFALPTLDGESTIEILGDMESADYVSMTLDTLTRHGIIVQRTKTGFRVPGGQKYTGGAGGADGDWSNGAIWLAAAAINGEITVRGLSRASLQGDRAILSALEAAGAAPGLAADGISVKRCALRAFDTDARNIPDLVPVLAALAANADGISTIRNVERLRLKECDRLNAVLRLLTSLGVQCAYDGALKIHGGKISGGCVDSQNDHRIVFAACLLALNASSPVTITNAEAVRKSYPLFFDIWTSLGGIRT